MSETTISNVGTDALVRSVEQGSRNAPYTLSELMVCAAAREIKDGELVFVGMRLPLIAFVVAKKTHAPNAIGLFENGVIRSTPAAELIYTMADPPNLLGATQCLDMLGVMSLLQSGGVDLGFLGAAEVDRFGNLNSTQVQGSEGIIRLPGSGGACDIASLAHHFVVLLEHRDERLLERLQDGFVDSEALLDGGAELLQNLGVRHEQAALDLGEEAAPSARDRRVVHLAAAPDPGSHPCRKPCTRCRRGKRLASRLQRRRLRSAILFPRPL